MPYFHAGEFVCRCSDHGCVGKTTPMDTHFLELLEKLRASLGVAIQINSGYRCPKHNAEVGGSPKSQHLLGKAADITCEPRYVDDLKEKANKVFENGGMGTAIHWCHVDVGPKRRWTYPS